MKYIFSFAILLLGCYSFSQEANVVKSYTVPAARQAVAVDSLYFYVINNATLTKHNKENGRLVKEWQDKDAVLHHLNSGIILNNKLYACHSNYPESPMASSIEIFDPKTLTHIDSHSFGIAYGSATWLDFYKGYWYVAFAHYTGKGAEPNKDNSWTRIVKFDEEWRSIESWIFPKELIKKFGVKSNSGGLILADGSILITGHDDHELYLLKFPKKGYTLQWKKTYNVGSVGQGIAIERHTNFDLIYGIIRSENKVVVSKIVLQ